jgi:hypothetical protein
MLELIAQGLSNPAITERMFLSEKTVRNNVCMTARGPRLGIGGCVNRNREAMLRGRAPLPQ